MAPLEPLFLKSRGWSRVDDKCLLRSIFFDGHGLRWRDVPKGSFASMLLGLITMTRALTKGRSLNYGFALLCHPHFGVAPKSGVSV